MPFERHRPIPRHVDLDLAGGVGQHRLGSSAGADIARPRTGRVMLFIAEVLGHLFVERSLEHRFGELFERPIRPGQRQAVS